MDANGDMRGVETWLEIELVDDVLPQFVIAYHVALHLLIESDVYTGRRGVMACASAGRAARVFKREDPSAVTFPCRMFPQHSGRFPFEILRHVQPGFPNRRVSGAFGEFAIPSGKFPQFLCFPHLARPSSWLSQDTALGC
jgi:hypothetical protein